MKNILFISLGCDKNLVDSEYMLGYLKEYGYQLTNEESEADAAVINTCCFIHDAKEESIQVILEMAELKKTGRLKVLIVAGCLSQRYQEEIQKEIPEVDALVGTASFTKIAESIEASFAGMAENIFSDIQIPVIMDAHRVNTTAGYYSYLKIAEGCSKHCTYCIIPSIKGDYKSVPIEKLIEEAVFLAESGVKELIVIAQETTIYGLDIYGKKMLPELLKRLCRIAGLKWIRLLYCYPEEVDDALIQVIKEESKICRYLDIPIQHASDTILRRMGRKTTSDEIKGLIKKLRSEIPDIALRTSLITGFPGETEEDHACMKQFVEEIQFDRLGVFTYSKEEDTPAAAYQNQIPKKTKVKRRNELMLIQQRNAFSNAVKKKGSVLTAIIDGRIPEADVYAGRTYMDSPDVDGLIFIHSDEILLSGDFVEVKITEAKEYDLIGVLHNRSKNKEEE